MLYYTKTVSQALKELASSQNGLSKSEAEVRLQVYGKNSITVRGEPLWRKLFEPFANVFVAVLAIASFISFLHKAYLDAGIILAIILISAIIYYIQRFSTERILRELQKHNPQIVTVWRDGKNQSIDASLLVPGDVITLSEGDKIPADARILSENSVRVDESQLTGESLPIEKQVEALSGHKEVYEQTNMLYQGSFIVSGEVKAVVTETGNSTEFGHLAALAKDTNQQSPLQKKIDKLISQIIAVVAAVAVLALALALWRGVAITDSIQFVLAISISAVPESLPVAMSVIVVLGMRRMATKKALVHTMRAIESIGLTTTIATDKTGTLTKNQLTVQTTWKAPGFSGSFDELIARSAMSSGGQAHDPLDTAITRYSAQQKVVMPRQQPITTLPFDQKYAMSGNIWHHANHFELFVKGAPEHILARCDTTENEHEIAYHQLHTLTSNGYRVLAIARSKLSKNLEDFSGLPKNRKLTFAGFVAIADVLRPEAKQAIKAAQNAGVTVRMITGDHFETAFHIGKQLGLVSSRNHVFDARRIHTLTDPELEKIIEHTYVFSRVLPEHKYRILTLLKKNHITAMTGDGVNDVPALASAHIGIAMGSGASIAKNAGDIILTDNNFKSIIDALKEGRIIYANIRRMLTFLLSTNTGEVLVVLGALLIGMPIPILPVHILWINLVTDASLVIPIGLEPGEKSIMKQPPMNPKAPILSTFFISRIVIVALGMAGVTLALYAFFAGRYGHEYGQTIAFSALVVMQWANAFCSRSDNESLFTRLHIPNIPLFIGLGVAVGLQLLVIFGPLGPLLHIASVSIGDLAIASALAFAVPVLLSEIHKYIGRRNINKP